VSAVAAVAAANAKYAMENGGKMEMPNVPAPFPFFWPRGRMSNVAQVAAVAAAAAAVAAFTHN